MAAYLFGDMYKYGEIDVYIRMDGFRTIIFPEIPMIRGSKVFRRRPTNCVPILHGHDGRILIEKLEPHNYIFIQEDLEVDIV